MLLTSVKLSILIYFFLQCDFKNGYKKIILSVWNKRLIFFYYYKYNSQSQIYVKCLNRRVRSPISPFSCSAGESLSACELMEWCGAGVGVVWAAVGVEWAGPRGAERARRGRRPRRRRSGSELIRGADSWLSDTLGGKGVSVCSPMHNGLFGVKQALQSAGPLEVIQ